MISIVAVLSVVAVAAATCDESVAERIVSVRVRPWADVLVDGRLAVRAAVNVDLALTPGAHVVSFHNPAAIDVNRVVIVPVCDEIADLTVELVRRPALLSVKSNLVDAEVAVCGPRVFAAATERAPMRIPMAATVDEADVLVGRAGHVPVVKRVKLQSGRRTRIAVRLGEE
ncbi:MAG: hypothetical protein Q8O67_22490 [Deltaproteobacteria bacterium]|nr:hypothetical protein [Deltaproteobacteria bacterium]